MPERRFDTGYWNDPDIMKLSMRAKLLYLYLWTNRHCNQAGLYEIALETIQWETGLELDEIPGLMQTLKKKVAWYPDQNLVWVKNFLHRQSQSPKFLAAAAKCLKTIPNNGLVKEFIEYNEGYTLSIPYSYPIDRVSIPSYSYALSYALSDKFSLFGSFSLLRDRLRKVASGSVDRLVEHERIKQELAKIGQEEGLDVQSEWQTKAGRVDLCWVDSGGKLVAAFEIDVYQPKEKSLIKLNALDCPIRCIILRTDESPYHLEQGIHIIGLGISREEEEEGKASLKGQKKKSASEGIKKGESIVNEIFAEMRAYLGYPDKISQDPIPSYGKEGQAIKRMLTRGFTREAIVECWKSKVSQRGGEFVSMTWVNQDIGGTKGQKRGVKVLSSAEEIAASIKEVET